MRTSLTYYCVVFECNKCKGEFSMTLQKVVEMGGVVHIGGRETKQEGVPVQIIRCPFCESPDNFSLAKDQSNELS